MPTWESDDIVMGYGNPAKNKTPLGEVRLHKFVQETKRFELWLVEYVDHPGRFYEMWIRKKNFDEIENHEENHKENNSLSDHLEAI